MVSTSIQVGCIQLKQLAKMFLKPLKSTHPILLPNSHRVFCPTRSFSCSILIFTPPVTRPLLGPLLRHLLRQPANLLHGSRRPWNCPWIQCHPFFWVFL